MVYDWQAVLVFLVSVVVLSKLGYWLAFRMPALREMRRINREEDAKKVAQDKYPPIVAANNRIGLWTNLAFFLVIAPFFVTLEPRPVWLILLETVAILMVYDLFYYVTHRFLFHGQGYFRQVHALHHQARKPTHIDAFYVHPLETFIGIALFMGTVVLMGLVLGAFHVATAILAYVAFIQLNTINHTYVNLPYFPFKTLSWITAKHAVHHENMHKGNYATITLLYDRLFGTLD